MGAVAPQRTAMVGSTPAHAAPQKPAVGGPPGAAMMPAGPAEPQRRTATVGRSGGHDGPPGMATAARLGTATARGCLAVAVRWLATVGPSAGPADRSRHASAGAPWPTPSCSIRPRGLFLPFHGEVEDVGGGQRTAAVHEREPVGDQPVDPVLLQELRRDVAAALGV